MATTTAQRRASTPRPSISPLSTTSKARNHSPDEARDAIMRKLQHDEDDNIGGVGPEAEGDHPDDRSSSLSEPEDDDDEEEYGRPNGADSSVARPLPTGVRASVEEDDSEAETERLDQTPQKLRKYTKATDKTPSKLSQQAPLDEELSDPPSPIPTGAGAASSTSTVAQAGEHRRHRERRRTMVVLTKTPADQGGKKRKRSADTADSPLTSEASSSGESPRKRSRDNSEPVVETEEPGGLESNLEGAIVEDTVFEKPSETPRSGPISPSKGGRGRKGKQKGKKAQQPVELEHVEDSTNIVEQEEATNDDTITANTQAELQQKEHASRYFDILARQFSAYRDLLYTERIATITTELQQLSTPHSTHPEFLLQTAAVDARRDKQIREAHAYHFYKMQALREKTLGERSQLHSQYAQHVRDTREQVMEELGKSWYGIQKERRMSQREGGEGFQYRFEDKRSEQVRLQGKYNQEVSVLSGVAKFVGFPAAPEMGAVEGDALDDDLRAMKIPKRAAPRHPNPQAYQPQHHQASLPPSHHHHAQPLRQQLQHQHHQQPTHPVYIPPSSQPARVLNIHSQNPPIHPDRLAHDQFIEQNAWARPQMPLHNPHTGAATPNLTHTPDWAEPHSSAKHLMRNVNGGGGAGIGRASAGNVASPFMTPGKRMGMAASEPPGSQGLGTSVMGDSAMAFGGGGGGGGPYSAQASRQGSPLQVHKRRQPQPSQPNGSGHEQQQGQPGQQQQAPAPGQQQQDGTRIVSGTSTIDAPLSQSNPPSSEPRPTNRNTSNSAYTATANGGHAEPDAPARPKLPLPTDTSAPLQAFDTSQMHRMHGLGPEDKATERAETYASVGFRPQEGAFGTPAFGTPVRGVGLGMGSPRLEGAGEGGR